MSCMSSESSTIYGGSILIKMCMIWICGLNVGFLLQLFVMNIPCKKVGERNLTKDNGTIRVSIDTMANAILPTVK